MPAWKYDGKTARIDFPSWYAFVDYARDRESEISESRCDSRRVSDGWHGTSSFPEAITLAETGWKEGAEKISRLASAHFDALTSLVERERLVYKECDGMAIDIGRYLEGDPEHWQDYETIYVESPGRNVIRLVYNCGASGGVSTEVIINRGATVAALVLLLERAGHGVEVVLGSCVTGAGHRVEICATIKRADQALDLMSLAYALAHPSTLRRLAFGVRESVDHMFLRAIGMPGSYGMPDDVADKGDLCIGKARLGEPQWTDPASARAWIIRQLRAQGVQLGD